ncbi:hypothetical protein GH714_016712 [Hevea brasiliensis]|uniref:Disease resistance protein At4g27190-like leucine-rich repeats domain-containing protein n=1 Tax=Hevea brasiliensis TaxID=3981 RepID=A0A6A6KPJ1_HEVBR|nr:hypothetical protein GH714_016712 [Hevea brasiliensis]
MKVLMGKAEILNLIKVINLKEVISTDECVEQGYLVDALQGIPRLPEIQLPYFGKLREINIHSCHELKYFIPLSMAKGLRQLHKISVGSCKEMEGIFYNSEVDDEVEFPELTDLELSYLPNFRDSSTLKNSFDQSGLSGKEVMYPTRLQNLKKLKISDCDSMEVIFSFEELIPEECHATTGVLNSMEEMRFETLSNLKHVLTRLLIRRKNTLRRIEDGQPSDGDLSNVRVLDVAYCQDWVNLIPYILIECLQKLEELSVHDCGSLMEIFDFEGVNADGGNVVTLSHLEKSGY